MKIILLFPPSWSLNVGGPHLAIPLLQSVLKSKGYNAIARDLNWEISRYYSIKMPLNSVRKVCELMTLESLNQPYFEAEDRLTEIAQKYSGDWNLQLGFDFYQYSFCSSKDVFEASQLDSPFTKYYCEKVIPWINKENPKIIGLSITSIYQLIPAFHLLWLLRKNGYKGIIVMGGNTISRLKEEIKIPRLFDLVDVLVLFQGEISLLLIAEAVNNAKSFESIPSIIWRKGEEIKVNPVFETLDPNTIPTPDFDGLPIGKYWGINYLPLVASRGCYYGKCSFCSIPYGWGNDGFAGIRNVSFVHQDMVNLSEKYGISRFKFMDESFGPFLLKKLSELILKTNKDFEWEAYLRFEKQWLDETFVDLLSRAGFKKAYFGLEIYPFSSRNILNKNDYAHKILDILENCHNKSIKTHLFCMFGFPQTGRKEAEATFEFILKYKDIIDTVDINPFVYSKHTYISGVRIIRDKIKDWTLEYEYIPENKTSLTQDKVEKLVSEFEELLWRECPRLLHPTYRFLTPWIIKEKECQAISDIRHDMAISY